MQQAPETVLLLVLLVLVLLLVLALLPWEPQQGPPHAQDVAS